MKRYLSDAQRRALRILNARNAGAIFIDRDLGWVWRSDIVRDPKMAERVVHRSRESKSKRRAA